MRIRLLTSLATAARAFDEGEVIDWPDAEAIRLVAGGQAVPQIEREIERAIAPPAGERRSKRAAKE